MRINSLASISINLIVAGTTRGMLMTPYTRTNGMPKEKSVPIRPRAVIASATLTETLWPRSSHTLGFHYFVDGGVIDGG